MEDAPKFESAEKKGHWRELKESAPTEAQRIIANIDGFPALTPEEQAAALRNAIEELVDDNTNRFTAGELERQARIIEEEARHAEEMARLEKAA